MSYTINKTNGTTLTQIVDGSVDQTTTDLTLIGKNASSYGTYINDNFVWLLENFANTSQPNHPIIGQLWFDTTENRLKVYDGSAFKVSGGTVVSKTLPSSITTGDIWINSATEQLFFNDGIQNVLAGPIYTSTQGQTGFIVQDVLDTNNFSHTIALLYVAQTLMGIFSKDAFTPASAIAGYTGSIAVGFNVSTVTGLKFNVPTSSAYSLIASDGSLKTVSNFLSTTGSSSVNGTLSIQNAVPLILGTAASTEFDVSTGIFNIKSNTSNQNFQVSTLVGSTVYPAIFVNATTSRVGIFTNTPSSTLDIAGDLTVEGNLNVLGTTTTINTINVNISDKVIILGAVASPTDTTANGGGISLSGATTKSFTWNLGTNSWTSTENINIAAGKTLKVNGFDVVTGSALGSVITSAPGLTSVGTLTSLNAGTLSITTNSLNATQTNSNIYLVPNGIGSVDVSSKTITSVATPVNGTDAANRSYVDASTQTAPHAVALTTTGFTNAQVASNYITKLFPVAEHQNNTVVRAFCTDLGTTQTVTTGSFIIGRVYMIVNPGDTTFTSIGAVSNTAGSIFTATGTGGGTTGTASPVIRTFQLQTGTWTYVTYS
jgi:hypothetical protein